MALGPFLLAILGVSGTIVGAGILYCYLSQVSKDRSEKTCALKNYYNWIMRKGSTPQKQHAAELMHKRDLQHLKDEVGDGFLVDP